ncbi:MAG: alpha/beta hydrolase [Pseudomonadota bacterium]
MSDETDDALLMPWRIAAAAIAGYGLFVGGMFLAQRHFLYNPGSDLPDITQSQIADIEAVTLTTEDGLELLAWYKPAEDGKQTFVVTHGNAGHIGHRTGKLAVFAEAGYGMLLVEYRGFGGNPGKPTEEGLYRDAEAGFAFLAERGIGAEQVIAYGESLGTAVAVQMAARHPVAAVVLEAPFSSIGDVAATHYWYVPMARWMVLDRFASDQHVERVEAPLLILHGGDDGVVPTRLGRKLFDAADEPKVHWLAPDADHNDLYDHGAGDVVLDFLKTHVHQN